MKTLKLFILIGFMLLLLPGISFAVIVSDCREVSTSMTLYNNIEGAPIDAAPFADTACIKITGSNLVFDCNGYNITNNGTSGNTYGILLNGSLTNVTVQNCGSVHGYVYGIFVERSDYNRIINNTADDNNYYGIYLRYSNFNNITNNSEYSSDYGIEASNSSGNRFEGNNMSDNTYHGFFLNTQSENNTLSSNHADSNGVAGFFVAESNNTDFSDNVAHGNGYYGIWLYLSNNNTLAGNNINDNSQYGLNTRQSSYTTLINNTVAGNSEYGIYLNASVFNNLTNNTVHSNTGGGIFVFDSNHTTLTADHYFNNTADLVVESALSNPFILNLSQVIFDNPLGNLANYTSLSLNDEVDANGSYSISWAETAGSAPNQSFEYKTLYISWISGTVSIERFSMNWLDSELSGYNENGFDIWKYAQDWTKMSAILDTAANALTMLNFVPASYYSILQSEATTPSTPSTSGGSDSKKPLTAFYGQVCPGDIIEVNVTSGASALENAEVRLIYLPTYDVSDLLTDANGQAAFTAPSAGDYKLIVGKSTTYDKEQIDFTYTACPSVDVPPVEPPPVEPPPVIIPPVNITIPPFLNVSDQNITNGMIDIIKAYLDQPGCIVLHVVNPDGSPGAVVGMSEVFSGNKSEFNLDLTNYNNETELMAMLHYDDGDGICEPAEDEPALIDGTLLSVHFKLTMPPAAPPVEPEPAPPAAPGEPETPEPADGFMGLLLLLLLVFVIVGGGAAAWYFFGMKKK